MQNLAFPSLVKRGSVLLTLGEFSMRGYLMGGPETYYEGITFGLLAIVRAKLRFQACRARKKSINATIANFPYKVKDVIWGRVFWPIQMSVR